MPGWLFHAIAILFMWVLFWGIQPLEEGNYRESFLILIISICAYGWLWEHTQSTEHQKLHYWDDRPPRPKPIANENLHWVQNENLHSMQNEVPTRDASRLNEHPLWTEDDEGARREPGLLCSNYRVPSSGIPE